MRWIGVLGGRVGMIPTENALSLAGVGKLGVADISALGRAETDPSTDEVHHRIFGHHADG